MAVQLLAPFKNGSFKGVLQTDSLSLETCLFPRRKACNDFNSEMLRHLTSKVHELPCTDKVNETCNPINGIKKTAEKLAKLNEACNMTAGSEAKVAVGAQVMMCHNIDTNAGLNYCHLSPFPLPPFPLLLSLSTESDNVLTTFPETYILHIQYYIPPHPCVPGNRGGLTMIFPSPWHLFSP